MTARHEKFEGNKKLDSGDVNLILGWAIYDLRFKTILEKVNLENLKQDFKSVENDIQFLSQMRIYATDALKSDSYLKNCYNPCLRVYNRGWLTLVNENYFVFGEKLMEKVSSSLTEWKISTEKNDIDKSKKEIKN